MHSTRRAPRALALLLAVLVGSAPALAAPPPWAGGGKGGGEEREDKHDRKAGKGQQEQRADKGGQPRETRGRAVARKAPAPGAYFDSRNRDAVRTYYASNPPRHCPPGLAKKNNGCLPPGQAKKWQVGQPLPREVVLAPVPQRVVVHLPPVPVGHRYVQVAGDILLIAVGSRMVVDGINGLMSR